MLKYFLTIAYWPELVFGTNYVKTINELFSFFRAKVYVYKESQLFALYYVFSKIFHIEYLKNT